MDTLREERAAPAAGVSAPHGRFRAQRRPPRSSRPGVLCSQSAKGTWGCQRGVKALGKCHLQKRHPVRRQQALLTAPQVCFQQGPLNRPEEPRPPTLRGGPSPTPRTPRGQQLPRRQAPRSLGQAQLWHQDQRELRSGKACAAPGELLQGPGLRCSFRRAIDQRKNDLISLQLLTNLESWPHRIREQTGVWTIPGPHSLQQEPRGKVHRRPALAGASPGDQGAKWH